MMRGRASRQTGMQASATPPLDIVERHPRGAAMARRANLVLMLAMVNPASGARRSPAIRGRAEIVCCPHMIDRLTSEDGRGAASCASGARLRRAPPAARQRLEPGARAAPGRPPRGSRTTGGPPGSALVRGFTRISTSREPAALRRCGELARAEVSPQGPDQDQRDSGCRARWSRRRARAQSGIRQRPRAPEARRQAWTSAPFGFSHPPGHHHLVLVDLEAAGEPAPEGGLRVAGDVAPQHVDVHQEGAGGRLPLQLQGAAPHEGDADQPAGSPVGAHAAPRLPAAGAASTSLSAPALRVTRSRSRYSRSGIPPRQPRHLLEAAT
jgi:hypothetical protein